MFSAALASAVVARRVMDDACGLADAVIGGVAEASGACMRRAETYGNDPQRAAHWFRVAAVAGDARAQFEMADRCYYGHGVKLDYDATMAWYCLLVPVRPHEGGRVIEQVFAHVIAKSRESSRVQEFAVGPLVVDASTSPAAV